MKNKKCVKVFTFFLDTKKQVLYEDTENKDDDPGKLDGHVDEFEIKDDELFKVASTGACISVHSAISLLHTYCSSLPSDGFCSKKPDFYDERLLVKDQEDGSHMMNQYVCKITLPMNVPEECRLITGKPAETKKKARKWASFQGF